jgi:hypothetical protein
MKSLDFFIFLWVIFALLDPDQDPATQINADPCGSMQIWIRNPDFDEKRRIPLKIVLIGDKNQFLLKIDFG